MPTSCRILSVTLLLGCSLSAFSAILAGCGSSETYTPTDCPPLPTYNVRSEVARQANAEAILQSADKGCVTAPRRPRTIQEIERERTQVTRVSSLGHPVQLTTAPDSGLPLQ